MGVLVCVFTHTQAIAYHVATYAESGHGDPTAGVNRSTATCENWPGGACVTGSCAHCHDIFDPNFCGNDPNGLMLFDPKDAPSQSDNFCFQCHDSASPVQAVTNNDYGSEFGGGTPNSTNIKDAFNFGLPNQASTTGSSHNLIKVRNWWKNQSGGDWVAADTNPCMMCHDHHLSQKNHDPYPVPPTYKTAVIRPDARSSGINTPGNLWGDEANSDTGDELLSEALVGYTYQAPLRVGGNYEPGGQPGAPPTARICRI